MHNSLLSRREAFRLCNSYLIAKQQLTQVIKKLGMFNAHCTRIGMLVWTCPCKSFVIMSEQCFVVLAILNNSLCRSFWYAMDDIESMTCVGFQPLLVYSISSYNKFLVRDLPITKPCENIQIRRVSRTCIGKTSFGQ